MSDHHDPVERLRQRGRAYLEFALAKPALFAVLLFEPPAAVPSDNPSDKTGDKHDDNPTKVPAETGKAFDDLVTDVSAPMATGQLRPADPLATALALWAAMHGVAALWAVTPDPPIELAQNVGDLVQDAVLAGLAG